MKRYRLPLLLLVGLATVANFIPVANADCILRQSDAVELALGPYVDATDGVTAETGLTISQGDVILKKCAAGGDCGASAQKNDSGACAHDASGMYECDLNATDTDTVGILEIWSFESGALPVFKTCQIIEEAVFDQKWAASATGAQPVSSGGITTASFASGAIDAAAIATDAVGSAEIAADAIGASELATDAIGATELASNAIAAAEIADAAIDDATFATTAGAFYSIRVVDQGTAQAATSTTIQLRSAAAFADDELIGAAVVVTGGSAGVGQARTITDYVSSTDTATVANWTTTPSGTITYKVFAEPPGSGGSVSISAGGITASSFAAGAIDASAIATDAIGAAELAANSITSSEVADDSIDAGAIAADSIGASEIATDAIGAAELASNAVAAAEIADGAIDDATFATTAGAFYALGVVDQGTAQAATSTTLQLRSAAAFADDEIIGATCLITGGSAGVGQSRTVTDYVSSTDTATVATWTTTPSGTVTYKCFGTSSSSGSVSIAAGGITASSFASGAIDATAIAADAIGASELATDAVGAAELAADAITSSEIAADAIGASELASAAITSSEFGSGAITATVIATDAITSAEIADDAVDAGAIAASAIGASELATDAIGAAEVASDVSTELLSGLAGLAVNATQISGDSGAADGLETAFDGTAGPVQSLQIARQGTAQSATGTTLVLDSSASFGDDTTIGMTLVACGSTQGYCQAREVTDYVSSTDTATVGTWNVTPSGTITYYMFASAPATGGGGGGLTASDVWSFGSRTLTAFDEDNTTIDVDGTTIGTATAVGTVNALANNSLTAAAAAADLTTELQSGLATASALATVDDFVDDLETRVGTPSNLGGGATLAANSSDIEAQTDDIGVAGAGLTAVDDAVLAAIAALNNLSATDVGNITIEDQGGGVSLKCAISVILAYAAGDIATSGANSTYEEPSGTETRITGSVASAGNRTATITCPTY